MPVELVSIYEEEFYIFYESDVSYYPLKTNLDFKDNMLDEEVVSFLIWNFTAFFINFAIENYNYGT